MDSNGAFWSHVWLYSLNLSDTKNKLEISKQMLDRMDQELTKIRQHIRQKIKEIQKKQKQYYDKHKKPLTFDLGDMVFLKLIPRRTYLILGKDKGLSPRFAGPFKILKKLSSPAYKFELHANVKAHPIFHVSLVKKYVSNPHHVLQENYNLWDDGVGKWWGRERLEKDAQDIDPQSV